MASTGPLRFLLYSHEGLGLGHLRRHLAIASALIRAAPGASVLLVTGAGAATRLGLERGVELLRLPTLGALRAGQITAAVRSFQPDLMLVDQHPLGASGELLPALHALRAVGGRAVLGFRDILDDPAEVRREWRRAGTLKLIQSNYDEILVYGMPRVLDAEEAYGLRSGKKCEVRYTGYVVHMAPWRDADIESIPPLLLAPRRRPVVLATAGGGEDGGRMLAAFIEAARRNSWQGLAVTGPEVPRDQRHSLRRAAVNAGVAFRAFPHDLATWLREADAVVCMGGYNILAEALFRGTPTVCVPRTPPQLIRARAFERLGLLPLLEYDGLDAERLSGAVAGALASSRPELARRALRTLDFHGAWRAAVELLQLACPVEAQWPQAAVESAPVPVSAA